MRPLVVSAAAAAVASDLLIPNAERVDVGTLVPTTHLDALAAIGLFEPIRPADTADLSELLAGACGNTFFIWAQHLGVQRILTPSSGQRWGIAFAHLRRRDAPLTAERRGTGWLLTGQASWLTGVGCVTDFALAAVCGPEIVWLRLPTERLSETVVEPLSLAAMNATGTCRVQFGEMTFGSDDVLRVESLADWLRDDHPYTARAPYGALGVGRRAVTLLAEREPDIARSLGDLLETARTRSIEDPTHEHRALAVLAASRCTEAFVASVAGSAMLRDHPAQRLNREAAFYLVQAQTPAIRAAMLNHLRG